MAVPWLCCCAAYTHKPAYLLRWFATFDGAPRACDAYPCYRCPTPEWFTPYDGLIALSRFASHRRVFYAARGYKCRRRVVVRWCGFDEDHGVSNHGLHTGISTACPSTAALQGPAKTTRWVYIDGIQTEYYRVMPASEMTYIVSSGALNSTNSTTGSWQDRWGDHLQSGDAANTRLIHSDNWRQIFDHSTTGCTRPSGFRRTAWLRCDEYATEEDTGRERGYKCSRGDDAAAAITRYNATALRNFTAPYYIIGAACVSGGMVGRDTTGKAPLLPADEHLGHRQCRLCIMRRLSVRRINRETFLLQRSSDELHFTITLWAQNGAK